MWYRKGFFFFSIKFDLEIPIVLLIESPKNASTLNIHGKLSKVKYIHEKPLSHNNNTQNINIYMVGNLLWETSTRGREGKLINAQKNWEGKILVGTHIFPNL